MNELALFAGAGGGILGSVLLGHRVVCAVEINPYCREVLMTRQEDGTLPAFPIWDDVRTFDGKPWRGIVDVVSAGFPCQPFSIAGRKRGADDNRNLWPDTIRIICEVGPRFALLENVPHLLAHDYFGEILGSLAEAGYDAEWGVIGATDVGAPHQRDRLFIFARREWTPVVFASECFKCGDCGEPVCPYCRIHYSECYCPGPQSEDDWRIEEKSWGLVAYPYLPGCKEQCWGSSTRSQVLAAECCRWWASEPDVGRVDHGVADRVERLKGLGNGQVPRVAQEAWRRLS